MTARSCISLILSFHFLSRAFTVPTVYREKNNESFHAKKSERRNMLFHREKSLTRIIFVISEKKKEKKNIIKNYQTFQVFRKSFLLIIACIIMKKYVFLSTKAGSHVTYGW